MAVETAYESITESAVGEWPPFDAVLKSKLVTKRSQRAQDWLERVGITPSESTGGTLMVNGKPIAIGVGWTRALQNELISMTQMLQQLIVGGAVGEDSDLSTVFYDLPSTLKRKAKYIVPKQGEKLVVYNLADVFNGTADVLAENFVYPGESSCGSGELTSVGDEAVPITTWIVGDLDSNAGLTLARNALEHLQTEGCRSRLGFVNVQPSGGSGLFSSLLFELISTGQLNTIKPSQLIEFIDELNSRETNVDQLTLDEIQAGQAPQELDTEGKDEPLNAFTGAGWTVGVTAEAGKFWSVGNTVAHRLGVNGTQPYVLVNGRLIGPIDEPDVLRPKAFGLLEDFEGKKRVDPVAQLVASMSIGDGKDIPR